MRGLLALLCLVSLAAQADVIPTPTKEGLYDTRKKIWLTLAEAVAAVSPGTFVVLGEQHVTKANENEPAIILHHANQLRWLKQMNREAATRYFNAQLGMEFLDYTDQVHVNDFLTAKITETEFLKSVKWGANPFEPYGRLMRESITTANPGTLALNIPREIAHHVATDGPGSLTQDERSYLPLIWERGGPEYFERFHDAMNGHVPEDKIAKYFWAQSLWDDTMAWRATRRHTPLDQITIIVGEFHAEFNHGLPARLKRYGAPDVRSMIQVAITSKESFTDAVKADPKYGERADYLWVFTTD